MLLNRGAQITSTGDVMVESENKPTPVNFKGAIDREALQRDMRDRRQAIVRRQAELDEWHRRQAELDEWREARTLERAREADEPPIIYKTIVNPPIERSPEPGEPDLPEWLEATSIALTETRSDMRAEFAAALEKAQAPLREHIARLEGQLSMLMTLLGDKPAKRKTRAIPAAARPLQLVKPANGA
jgi:hypothetical protein